MKTINLPRVGDVLFFWHCEVVVTKVLTCFHMVKICCVGADSKAYVDANALSLVPERAYSISLRCFGRGGDERIIEVH
jgi:hypothetical protein